MSVHPDRILLVDAIVRYLSTSTGMKVLDREWEHDGRTAAIVATERNSLVIVIPSVRPAPRDLPNIVKRQARVLGLEWMRAHGVCFDHVRVDYVSYTALPMGQSNIDHIRGIG